MGFKTCARLFDSLHLATSATMVNLSKAPWRSHSRLFLACGVVIMSPFQYGFDFGMIGGLQAMKAFLQVRSTSVSIVNINLTQMPGLRISLVQISYRMEHHHRATAAHLVLDDSWCFHQLCVCWCPFHSFWTTHVSRHRLCYMFRGKHHHDDHR